MRGIERAEPSRYSSTPSLQAATLSSSFVEMTTSWPVRMASPLGPCPSGLSSHRNRFFRTNLATGPATALWLMEPSGSLRPIHTVLNSNRPAASSQMNWRIRSIGSWRRIFLSVSWRTLRIASARLRAVTSRDPRTKACGAPFAPLRTLETVSTQRYRPSRARYRYSTVPALPVTAPRFSFSASIPRSSG